MVTGTDTISAFGIATSSTRIRRRFSKPSAAWALPPPFVRCCRLSLSASPAVVGVRASLMRDNNPHVVLVSGSCAPCAALEDPVSSSPIFPYRLTPGTGPASSIWVVETHGCKYLDLQPFHQGGIGIGHVVITQQMQHPVHQKVGDMRR